MTVVVYTWEPNANSGKPLLWLHEKQVLLAEAFSIEGDLIQQVEAVGTSVPYHSDPGWTR